MTKPFSIRLQEDDEKFIESLTSDDLTKADIINAMLRTARENMEKGIEATTEIRIPLSRDAATKTAELRKALQEINKEMRSYSCYEWERLYAKKDNGSNIPRSIAKFPCIKDVNHDCQAEKKWCETCQEDVCPLYTNKEWRQLLAENLV